MRIYEYSEFVIEISKYLKMAAKYLESVLPKNLVLPPWF